MSDDIYDAFFQASFHGEEMCKHALLARWREPEAVAFHRQRMIEEFDKVADAIALLRDDRAQGA